MYPFLLRATFSGHGDLLTQNSSNQNLMNFAPSDYWDNNPCSRGELQLQPK